MQKKRARPHGNEASFFVVLAKRRVFLRNMRRSFHKSGNRGYEDACCMPRLSCPEMKAGY